MRLSIVAAGTLLLFGCREQNQPQGNPQSDAPNPEERILYLRPDTLPALLLGEVSETLDSVGSTATIESPLGAEYIVRVYLHNGAEESEVMYESGRASSSTLEIGLYCIRDYRISDGEITIDPKGERVALDLPGSSRTEIVPQWNYRPMIFHTKKVTPTMEELPIIVMYHGNEMHPGNFDAAAKFARERHVESLVATIQLKQSIGEQDGGGKGE